MDIDLNEEQEMLRKTARDFLVAKGPATFVREMMEDERGFPPDLWREIADLGWLGLIFPTEGRAYVLGKKILRLQFNAS